MVMNLTIALTVNFFIQIFKSVKTKLIKNLEILKKESSKLEIKLCENKF